MRALTSISWHLHKSTNVLNLVLCTYHPNERQSAYLSWILARTRLAISPFPHDLSLSKGIICVNTTICCSHRNQFSLQNVIYFNIQVPKTLWILIVRSNFILCVNVCFLVPLSCVYSLSNRANTPFILMLFISWLFVYLLILQFLSTITPCCVLCYSGDQHTVHNHKQRRGVWRWRERSFWDSFCPHRLWFSRLQLPLQTWQPYCWASCCVALCCKGGGESFIHKIKFLIRL